MSRTYRENLNWKYKNPSYYRLTLNGTVKAVEMREWMRKNIKNCYRTARPRRSYYIEDVFLTNRHDLFLFNLRYSDIVTDVFDNLIKENAVS